MAEGWVNTPERLIERSEPFLEPGEVVAHVVRAQEGPKRWIGLGGGIVVGIGLGILLHVPMFAVPIMWVVYTRMYSRRVILATDRNLLIVAGGHWRYTPRGVLDRLDIETKIGPLKGLFLETKLNGRRLYVVPRCAAEVKAADAEVDTA
jgi:hypothetical protein